MPTAEITTLPGSTFGAGGGVTAGGDDAGCEGATDVAPVAADCGGLAWSPDGRCFAYQATAATAKTAITAATAKGVCDFFADCVACASAATGTGRASEIPLVNP